MKFEARYTTVTMTVVHLGAKFDLMQLKFGPRCTAVVVMAVYLDLNFIGSKFR